ncbi:MAG: hypothetical protein ACTSWR_10445 [Candidatus Helarchaeota archaeon]
MEVQINTLKKMVQDLTKQNKALKGKITNLEDEILSIRGKYKVSINLPPIKNSNIEMISKYIENTMNNLSIITPYIDSFFVKLLIKIIRTNNIKIQIITNERRQIRQDRPDLLQGYDDLQLNKAITHVFNSLSKQTIILQDNKNLLLCSTCLSKEDLNDTFNYIIAINDQFILEKFEQQLIEQLPPFLRH